MYGNSRDEVERDPAFQGLSSLAKDAIAFSREVEANRVTPGVEKEIIWRQGEARTVRDIQDVVEFWLSSEGMDLSDSSVYRTDGVLSTFVFNGFLFNSLIKEDPIFDYCNMLILSCYVYKPNTFDPQVLLEFNKVNHPGSFHLRESSQSDTGFFVQCDQYIFGEPKALQHAIGTALNLSVDLASQIAPYWISLFGGEVIDAKEIPDFEMD
jgi:hypothetical protein